MTYSYPKVTKCYPNVNYSGLKRCNETSVGGGWWVGGNQI